MSLMSEILDQGIKNILGGWVNVGVLETFLNLLCGIICLTHTYEYYKFLIHN